VSLGTGSRNDPTNEHQTLASTCTQWRKHLGSASNKIIIQMINQQCQKEQEMAPNVNGPSCLTLKTNATQPRQRQKNVINAYKVMTNMAIKIVNCKMSAHES
jgi:hypothetical protein